MIINAQITKAYEKSGAVVFDHVRFAYPENPDKIIIKDFLARLRFLDERIYDALFCR